MNFDDFIAIIPARAGSKGLPNKNVLAFQGRPLYVHTVTQGLDAVGSCIITTDIDEIDGKNISDACTVVRRPPRLATDEAVMSDVIRHCILASRLHDKIIVLLQVTTPLRSTDDIIEAMQLYKSKRGMVMSVVKKNNLALKYGFLQGDNFIPVSEPNFCFMNRQTLPDIYGANGAIYIFSADDFLKSGGFPAEAIHYYEMPQERSLDIDTLDDYTELLRITSQKCVDNA